VLRRARRCAVLDIAYIAIVLVFFALAALGVRACERL
jgi:hypothetical protein